MASRASRAARLLAAALAGAPWMAMASPNEITVDVTNATGSVALVYGAHTLGASVATGVDLDTYTFDAVAGDHLRLALTTLTVNLDPLVRLRDPTGAIVRTVSCSAGSTSGCSLDLDETIAANGRYTLNVSDNGTDNAGNYVLHLDRYPPVNNWLGVAYASPHDDAVGHQPDMDFYAFRGVAGTAVNLSLQTLTVDLDPKFEVWGPTGAKLVDTGCSAGSTSGCSVSLELAIATDGLYRIGINDQGWDNLGNYRLQVSCAFGNCPSPIEPPPLPVPEPATWALWLAGAGLLARRLRPGRASS